MKVSRKAALLMVALVFVLTALLCFGGIPIYAVPTGQPITEQEIRETIAPRWIDRWYGDETTLREIVPVYGDKEKPVGYEVDFEKNGQPNGYLMLNLYKNLGSAIPEFALDGEGVYAQLKNKAESSPDTVACGRKKLYRSKAFDYAVDTIKNNVKKAFDRYLGFIENKKLLNRTNQFIKQFQQVIGSKISYGGIEDSMHDLSSIGSWLLDTYGHIVRLPGVQYYDFVEMDSLLPSNAPSGYQVATGNCAPTATTNIAIYFSKKGYSNILPNGSIQNAYNRIVSLSGFKQYVAVGADPSGSGLSDSKAISTLKSLGKERGYTVSSDTYWFDLFSDFTRDIDAGKPVYTSIPGHALVTIGYMTLQTQTANSKFLLVSDGWYTNRERFIDFKPTRLSSIDGYAISIH